MRLIWWLRWQGLRLFAGDLAQQQRGWGQPARVRVRFPQSRIIALQVELRRYRRGPQHNR